MSIVVTMEGFGGGGTSLNFKVVGNPQPENPKSNTIWVNTDVPITSWIFSATQPQNLAEGDVWFPVGTSNFTEFNALRKNGIMVYPISAKQYVEGSLVDKPAKIYQNNEWIDLKNFLFHYGKQSYTWKAIGKKLSSASNNTAKAPTATTNADGSVTLKMPGGTSSMQNRGGYICEQSVDLTDITSITLKFDLTATGGYELGLYILPLNVTYYGDFSVRAIRRESDSAVNELTADVSKLSGYYDVFIGLYASASQTLTAVIKEVLAQ